ncbi:MAG: hypothetical protein WC222_08730 [Parachlamydiales bacterium]|jgi:hypothetical protein
MSSCNLHLVSNVINLFSNSVPKDSEDALKKLDAIPEEITIQWGLDHKNIGELIHYYVQQKGSIFCKLDRDFEDQLYAQLIVNTWENKDNSTYLRNITAPYITKENSPLYHFELALFLERHGATQLLENLQKNVNFPWVPLDIQICAYQLSHCSAISYIGLKRQLDALTHFTPKQWHAFWGCYNRFAKEKIHHSIDCTKGEEQLLETIKQGLDGCPHLEAVCVLVLLETLQRKYHSQISEKLLFLLPRCLKNDFLRVIPDFINKFKTSFPTLLHPIMENCPVDDEVEWTLSLLSTEHPVAQACARAMLRKIIKNSPSSLEDIAAKAHPTGTQVIIRECTTQKYYFPPLLKIFWGKHASHDAITVDLLVGWTIKHPIEAIEFIWPNCQSLPTPHYKTIFEILFQGLLDRGAFEKSALTVLDALDKLSEDVHAQHLPKLILALENTDQKYLLDVVNLFNKKYFHIKSGIASWLRQLGKTFNKDLKELRFVQAIDKLKIIHRLCESFPSKKTYSNLVLRLLKAIEINRLSVDCVTIMAEFHSLVSTQGVTQNWTADSDTYIQCLPHYFKLARFEKNTLVMRSLLQLARSKPLDFQYRCIEAIFRLFPEIPYKDIAIEPADFISWFNESVDLLENLISIDVKGTYVPLIKYAHSIITKGNLYEFIKKERTFFLHTLRILLTNKKTQSLALSLMDACLDMHSSDLQKISPTFGIELDAFFDLVYSLDVSLAEKIVSKKLSGPHCATTEKRQLLLLDLRLRNNELNYAISYAEKHLVTRKISEALLARITLETLNTASPELIGFIKKNLSHFQFPFQMAFYILVSKKGEELLEFETLYLNALSSLNLASHTLTNDDLTVLQQFIKHSKDNAFITKLSFKIIEAGQNPLTRLHPKMSELVITAWGIAFRLLTALEFSVFFKTYVNISNHYPNSHIKALISQTTFPSIPNLMLQIRWLIAQLKELEKKPSDFLNGLLARLVKTLNQLFTYDVDSIENQLLSIMTDLCFLATQHKSLQNDVDWSFLLPKLLLSSNPSIRALGIAILSSFSHFNKKVCIKMLLECRNKIQLATDPQDPLHPGILSILRIFVSSNLLPLKHLNAIFLSCFNAAIKKGGLITPEEMKDDKFSFNRRYIDASKAPYHKKLSVVLAEFIELLMCSPHTDEMFSGAILTHCGILQTTTNENRFEIIDEINSLFKDKNVIIEHWNCKVTFCCRSIESALNAYNFLNNESHLEEFKDKIFQLNDLIVQYYQHSQDLKDLDLIISVYATLKDTFNPDSNVMKLRDLAHEHIKKSLATSEEATAHINHAESNLLLNISKESIEKVEKGFDHLIKSILAKVKNNTFDNIESELNLLLQVLYNINLNSMVEMNYRMGRLRPLIMELLKMFFYQKHKDLYFSNAFMSLSLFIMEMVYNCMTATIKNEISKPFDSNCFLYIYFALDMMMYITEPPAQDWFNAGRETFWFELLQSLFRCEILMLTYYKCIIDKIPKEVQPLISSLKPISNHLMLYRVAFENLPLEKKEILFDPLCTLLSRISVLRGPETYSYINERVHFKNILIHWLDMLAKLPSKDPLRIKFESLFSNAVDLIKK